MKSWITLWKWARDSISAKQGLRIGHSESEHSLRYSLMVQTRISNLHHSQCTPKWYGKFLKVLSSPRWEKKDHVQRANLSAHQIVFLPGKHRLERSDKKLVTSNLEWGILSTKKQQHASMMWLLKVKISFFRVIFPGNFSR